MRGLRSLVSTTPSECRLTGSGVKWLDRHMFPTEERSRLATIMVIVFITTLALCLVLG